MAGAAFGYRDRVFGTGSKLIPKPSFGITYKIEQPNDDLRRAHLFSGRLHYRYGNISIQITRILEAGTGIEPVYTDLQWNVRV